MKKRITKLIRVSEKWHAYAKAEAAKCRKTISKIADEAFSYHSGERKKQDRDLEAKLKVMFPFYGSAKNPPKPSKPSMF